MFGDQVDVPFGRNDMKRKRLFLASLAGALTLSLSSLTASALEPGRHMTDKIAVSGMLSSAETFFGFGMKSKVKELGTVKIFRPADNQIVGFLRAMTVDDLVVQEVRAVQLVTTNLEPDVETIKVSHNTDVDLNQGRPPGRYLHISAGTWIDKRNASWSALLFA